MLLLPKEFVLAKFRQYSGNPIQTGMNWNASCPICHEGKHWLKKKRLYYLSRDNYIYCHNCSESWTPLNWIKEVSGQTIQEILHEMNTEGYDCYEKEEIVSPTQTVIEILPTNSIDLSNPQQLEFYKNNKVVQNALLLIQSRRLSTAHNKCQRYFLSLDDWKYRNRVIIPYYDFNDRICFYTARSLYKNQTPKYLNKVGEKEVFGIDKVDASFPYIFVFEGQIDSMFIKNGVAISGVTITEHQMKIIKNHFPEHELIWVLDNPKIDETSRKLIKKRAKETNDFRCFVYHGRYAEHKDLNAYCVAEKIDSVDVDDFIKNCKKGNAVLLSI
jgi:hypothetical protein